MTKTTPHLAIVKPEPRITAPNVSNLMVAQEEFFKLFNITATNTTKELYITLIEEEHEEWVEEFYSDASYDFAQLKELTDLLYATCGLCVQMQYQVTSALAFTVPEYYDYSITDIVSDIATGDISSDTLRKLIYAIYGYAQSKNWDIEEAYRRVHKSNLSKLDVNNTVIRREDGKILKSENYKEPYLEDLTDGR